jgi:hypothetical protein
MLGQSLAAITPIQRSVDPYHRKHPGMPGQAILSTLSLQFGRVAAILTFVDCQSNNSATFDVQSTGKEAHGITVMSCSADI